jgi:hypothetical protein
MSQNRYKEAYDIIREARKWIMVNLYLNYLDKLILEQLSYYALELKKLMKQIPLQWYNHWNFYK